ncbi:hypothetical protein QBC46DRAFT_406340 [Diplogelasinospora grovesii]|uniref:Uncharacterized protein n=1 Tax=Diplogelasinospora grovesii TaxID=303347 RepID=A0AAN6S6K5_9PEZI|nr:hypothetical protein QBC46DRAFT_406340 [Diplogelasinospora grovesii]
MPSETNDHDDVFGDIELNVEDPYLGGDVFDGAVNYASPSNIPDQFAFDFHQPTQAAHPEHERPQTSQTGQNSVLDPVLQESVYPPPPEPYPGNSQEVNPQPSPSSAFADLVDPSFGSAAPPSGGALTLPQAASQRLNRSAVNYAPQLNLSNPVTTGQQMQGQQMQGQQMPSSGNKVDPYSQYMMINTAYPPQTAGYPQLTGQLPQGQYAMYPGLHTPQFNTHFSPQLQLGPASYHHAQFAAPLASPMTPNLDGKKIDHKRQRRNDPDNDATKYYRPPLGAVAEPWGPLDDKKRHIFEYATKGGIELAYNRRYSTQQLLAFFRGHHAGRQRLTLWIQNTPAQVNNRYFNPICSSKCRWDKCPSPSGTILKGFYRVAFDEFSDWTGVACDPFHNAGYMHLYCFELAFDLPQLIEAAPLMGFEIKPDVRELSRETRNPMALTRDHMEMLDAYNTWRTEQADSYQAYMADRRRSNPKCQNMPYIAGRQKTIREHDRLWFRLTQEHIRHEVKGRALTRTQRGGADIDKHKGNLERYLELKEEIKKKKKRQRKREEEDSDSEDDDESDGGDDDDNDDDDNNNNTGGEDSEYGGGRRKRVKLDECGVPRKPPFKRRSHNTDAPPGQQQQQQTYSTQSTHCMGTRRSSNGGNGGLKTIPEEKAYNNNRKNGGGGGADDDEVVLDDSWLNQHQPANANANANANNTTGNGNTWQHRPQTEAERVAEVKKLLDMPRTRKRSRDIAGFIETTLQDTTHLTRTLTHGIKNLLGDEPVHVRQSLLTGYPDDPRVKQMLEGFTTTTTTATETGGGGNNGSSGESNSFNNLGERVNRLPYKRQRREVEGFVARQERLDDPRRFHSI